MTQFFWGGIASTQLRVTPMKDHAGHSATSWLAIGPRRLFCRGSGRLYRRRHHPVACLWGDSSRRMILLERSVFWLIPKRAAFINGHALAVDGGWTAGGRWEWLRHR